MFLKRLFLLGFCSVALVGCASTYEEGKSAADLPAHVDVIRLLDVYITGSDHVNVADGDPDRDLTPSQNDQEVLAIAKANIASQFTNLGYQLVEPDQKADIAVKFFVYYQPERWPLTGRNVNITSRFYDLAGTPIFHAHAGKVNAFGLIGALVGPSRDDMVSEAARNAVVKAVEELRKGTLDNKPVVEDHLPTKKSMDQSQ